MQRQRTTSRHVTALRLCAGVLALGLLSACAERAPPPSFGPISAEPVTVIVQRGDTLIGIARRHNLGVQPLAAANGMAPPYRLRPGQVLHLPGVTPVAPPPVAVASGGSALGSPGATQPSFQPASPSVTATVPAAPTGRTVTAEALPPPPSAAPTISQPAPPLAGAVATQPPASPPRTAEASRAEAPPGQAPAAREQAASRPTAEPAPRRLPPGRFAWPVRGEVVSGFGSKGGGMVNDGLNIAAPRGTPVRAAAEGVVLYSGNEVRGFGNLVLIRHDNGWVTAYGHADRVLVRQGQRVRLGEEIARVGSTGAVGSPQLHFQVRRDGKPVDPAAHLERAVAGR